MTRPECVPLKQAAEQAELVRAKLAEVVQSAQQAEQFAQQVRDLLQRLYEACEMGGGPQSGYIPGADAATDEIPPGAFGP